MYADQLRKKERDLKLAFDSVLRCVLEYRTDGKSHKCSSLSLSLSLSLFFDLIMLYKTTVFLLVLF